MVYTERAMVESGNCKFFYTQRGHCGTMYVAHSTSAVTDTTANGNKIYATCPAYMAVLAIAEKRVAGVLHTPMSQPECAVH